MNVPEEVSENHTCIVCIEEGADVVDTPCPTCRITMHQDCYEHFRGNLVPYNCPICRTKYTYCTRKCKQNTVVPYETLYEMVVILEETETPEERNNIGDSLQCKIMTVIVTSSLIWVICIMYFLKENIFDAVIFIVGIWCAVLALASLMFFVMHIIAHENTFM